MSTFQNRHEAGRLLAAQLGHLRRQDPVILGLPRGGVPVAAEVASALDAPLDVIVVRKLGLPGQPELAMGAIGEGGARVINDRIHALAHPELAAQVEAAERAELERRVESWRSGRQAVPLAGRTVIIVDDGIATGATATVACHVARQRGAARVSLAVPVAPPDNIADLLESFDEVVALRTPAGFQAVGQFYADFSPTTDAEVTRLLGAPRP